jgi:hypothetical protein
VSVAEVEEKERSLCPPPWSGRKTSAPHYDTCEKEPAGPLSHSPQLWTGFNSFITVVVSPTAELFKAWVDYEVNLGVMK